MADTIQDAGILEVVRLKPKAPFFVVIDGTNAVDAAYFGLTLRDTFGWENLLDHLPPATDSHGNPELGRLDPGPKMPFLPVLRVNEKGNPTNDPKRGAVIVAPGGSSGYGLDAFWARYDDDGEARTWEDKSWVTHGRHTAAEQSARVSRNFVLCPSAQIEQRAGARLELTSSPEEWFEYRKSRAFAADLLVCSWHGYYGGFTRNELVLKNERARPAPARGTYRTRADPFSLGRAVKEEAGFWGPLWVIMAQCSTCNLSTAPHWVEVFLNSHPQVRGILAYEDLSPSPVGTVKVTREWFRLMKDEHKSFLEAWIEANGSRPGGGATVDRNLHPPFWSALVHQDALKDTILDWQRIEENPVSGSSYLWFGKRHLTGTKVVDRPPPFVVELSHHREGKWYPIEYHSLDQPDACFERGGRYRLQIKLEGGGFQGASVEFVQSRPYLHFTRRLIVKLFLLFTAPAVTVGSGEAHLDQAKVVYTPKDGATESFVEIQLQARSTVVPFHTYLWLQGGIIREGKETIHDFAQIGIRDKLGH